MASGVEFVSESIPDVTAAKDLIERLYDVAKPDAVFSKPVDAGEYKVITASTVRLGLGAGFGGGGGYDPNAGDGDSESESEVVSGYGGGGGGGGFAVGRPVAAIEIGPQGVRVEPIVDPTSIAIAFFTTLVSMIAMMGKMRRAR